MGIERIIFCEVMGEATLTTIRCGKTAHCWIARPLCFSESVHRLIEKE